MAEDLAPLTLLGAVNQLLGSIGEQPVASLEDPGLSVDVSLAKNLVTQVSREVQMVGWDFNTDRDYPMVPDINGVIAFPASALKVDSEPSEGMEIVQRGSQLYDRLKRTFIFDKTIKCEVVWFFPFEEIPQAARHYITVRAARMFQDRTVGAADLHGYQAQDELDAKVKFEHAASTSEDNNSMYSSPFAVRLYNR